MDMNHYLPHKPQSENEISKYEICFSIKLHYQRSFFYSKMRVKSFAFAILPVQ